MFLLFCFLYTDMTILSCHNFHAGFTPKGAATHQSVVGSTPGRTSVRDKLSINREEAFETESESDFSKRQQQVNGPSHINSNVHE